VPWILQTARTDRQRAKNKQPAEADQLSQAMSDNEAALYLCEKIGLPVMGDKTLFVRPGHIYCVNNFYNNSYTVSWIVGEGRGS